MAAVNASVDASLPHSTFKEFSQCRHCFWVVGGTSEIFLLQQGKLQRTGP